jgi:surface protein
VTNFNTSKVTNMNSMFSDCSGLTSLDVTGFNTANVTLMVGMFSGCTGLTDLDLSHFDTNTVKNMNSMFSGCSGLTSLDLSHFDTPKVIDMIKMFNGCSALTSIYVGNGWNTDAVTYSKWMFTGCTNLVGGRGTAYDENHVDVAYAHIDGGPSNPGYFTAVSGSVGDVNGDGFTNIADVTQLINYLLNDPTQAPASADVNGDGIINIADVTQLINDLLSGN